MTFSAKIILHSISGYRPELNILVEQFIKEGVKFVGVVGEDCAKIENVIDELCVGNGANPYFMLTSSHAEESLQEAIEFGRVLAGEYGGEVEVVEF
jgi:hypothetical protein